MVHLGMKSLGRRIKMRTVLSILFSLFLIVQVQAQTMGISGGSVPQYVPNAWDFDLSSNQRIQKSSDLDGNVDGKKGIISFWFRLDISGTNTVALDAQGSAIEVLNDTSQLFTIILRDESVDVVTYGNQTGLDAGTGWHHFLTSWDVGVDAFHLYMDDVSNLSGAPSSTGNDIDYTRSQHGVSGAGASQWWDGCIADVYINYVEFMDFSVVSNRRKFININKKPVFLGSDGSGPTGNQPIVYLKNAFGSVTTNFGSGGNFTSSSATACSDNP